VTAKQKEKFIELQFQQQLKGLYPVVQIAENEWTWTIGEFPDVDFWAKTFTSAIFEWKGAFWRAGLFMPSKRAALIFRYLDFYVEFIAETTSQSSRQIQGQVSLDHPTDKKRSISLNTGSSRQFSTSQKQQVARVSMSNMQDIYSSFFHSNRSIKLSFTLSGH